MQILKFTLATIVGIALFTLAGCTPTPTPDPTPVTPTVTNNCALESQKDGVNNVITLTYDAQHRIQKQSFYNTTGTLLSTSEYEYNADGRVSKKINRDASAISIGFSLYEYNATGKLTFERKYNSNGVLTYQDEYIYNSSAQLSRKNSFYNSSSGGLFPSDYYTYQHTGNSNKPSRMDGFFGQASQTQTPSSTSYTYDGNDNIINESSTYNISSKTSTVVRTFDTKQNALITFAGLKPTAVTGTVSENGIAGKNNVLSEVRTTYFNSGSNTQNTVIQTTYTYTFDAKGNPTTQAVRPTSGTAKDYIFGFHCH